MAGPTEKSWRSSDSDSEAYLYDECSSGGPNPTNEYEPLQLITISEDGTMNLCGQQKKTLVLPHGFDKQMVKALHLDYNAFHVVPPCVCEMTKVKNLSLYCQNDPQRASKDRKPFLKELPLEISQLTDMQCLRVGCNVLSNLPATIVRLEYLKTLDLRLNQFKLFPEVIFDLKSLTALILSGNLLTRIPQRINQMSKLEELHLGNNKIREVPREICELEKLKTLVLRNNRIEELPYMMYNLKELATDTGGSRNEDEDDDKDRGLKLEGNPMRFPPPRVCDKGTVAVLDYLRHHHDPSKVSLDIHGKGIQDLTHIIEKYSEAESINASQNKLAILPERLVQLNHLDTLVLDENRFKNIPVEVLKEVRSLKVLSIRRQKEEGNGAGQNLYETLLKVPNDMYLCQTVTELYLAENAFAVLPQSLGCLKTLKVLDVQGNNIKSVPSEICDLTNLECLCLSSNALTEIPMEIGQMTKMKVLRLSKNQLKTIPDTVCQLRELLTLSLRQNDLRYLPPNINQLEKLRQPGKFLTLHVHYKNELKVEDNENIEIPPVRVCKGGVNEIFEYLQRMKRENASYLKRRYEELRRTHGGRRERSREMPTLDGRLWAMLSRSLDGGACTTLGLFLGMDSATIDRIARDHPLDIQTQIVHILSTWHQSIGSQGQQDAAMQLRQALLQIGRRDIVDELFSDTC